MRSAVQRDHHHVRSLSESNLQQIFIVLSVGVFRGPDIENDGQSRVSPQKRNVLGYAMRKSVGVLNIPIKYHIDSIRASFEFREVRLDISQPA